jgi:hypothetical protein
LLDAPVATILAAIVAFVGTMLGLVVGYRRWTKERKSARFAKFEADQQEIYKSLWERVEDVNVALRRDRVDQSGFAKLVADLNEFMLRNGAHLDDSDTELVNRYVAAVKRFHEAVCTADAEAQIPYGQTQEIPPEITGKIAALGDAADEASRLRDELRHKVRTILAGEP